MYSLKAKASFDSAHFLHGYEGKCANIHGHRWVIETQISAEGLQKDGVCRDMLIDFSELKKAVRFIADSYDHALIYEKNTLRSATVEALVSEGFSLICVEFRPTAENFARHFYKELHKKGLPVSSVTVYETPDNAAVYEE